MHAKNSEKEDEIDDKKVAVPPVARAVHVNAVRRAILQQAEQHRRKALRRRAAIWREKSGSRAPSPCLCLLEAPEVTIGAGEHQSVDLSARTAAGMAVDSR